MKRNIININEELCNGCGICVDACHEGAIQMIDGKARLVSESYCDGLGDCLPECPTGAITMEEREAEAYDEEAVKAAMSARAGKPETPLACGCPGSASRSISRSHHHHAEETGPEPGSELQQWPVQIKLVPINAPYFDGARLLIAADCTAYAYAGIHKKFIRDRVTIIGCPKLDMVDYTEKLTAIFKNNDIKSVLVLRMEVPCCGGIVSAARNALMASGKYLPWSVVTVTTDGRLIES